MALYNLGSAYLYATFGFSLRRHQSRRSGIQSQPNDWKDAFLDRCSAKSAVKNDLATSCEVANVPRENVRRL